MKKVFVIILAFGFAISMANFKSSAYAAKWSVPGDFSTIQEAIDNANDGDKIMVGPGNFDGALVTKAVEIKGIGGATINYGPLHPAGFTQGFRLLSGSNGCTISHLRFEVGLSIMNGEAVDDVSVTQCTFINAVQAISNWRGSGWNITHNEIIDLRTRCGGGIGILVADFSGGDINDNLVAHNKITGTLHVSPGDCGGYNGSGIVLFADFRWGRLGATGISWNRVVKNHVSLTSDTPGTVDVVAIELTDTRDDATKLIIKNNAIGFNDLRGTTLTIDLTPDELENLNNISRTLGENPNRGHGLHPSLFGPGGN